MRSLVNIGLVMWSFDSSVSVPSYTSVQVIIDHSTNIAQTAAPMAHSVPTKGLAASPVN